MNATVISLLDSARNVDDLFARDQRAFRAAGIRPIGELARFDIRAASDAMDWRRGDLLRIPGVGKATVDKLLALIAMQ